MKVRFDVLLSKLGCQNIASVDKPHTCPKCHRSPPSMRISYLRKTTYFICSSCGMCVDAVKLAALCLQITAREARALFEPSGPLHETLVPGESEYTVTDYINATNSQAIINDLYATATVRIKKPVALVARNWLDVRGVGGTLPADTGSLAGATLRRLIKAGALYRVGKNAAPLYLAAEYVTHFTRYAGGISGMRLDCTHKKGGSEQLVVAGNPGALANGVYASHADYAPTADTLYVFSSPLELCKYHAKRFIYTRQPVGAIAIQALPLPPDYCKARNIVFVTDGSESFDSFIVSTMASTTVLPGVFRQPDLHVFDGKGRYETREPERMLLQAQTLSVWYTNRLLATYRSGGESAAAMLLSRTANPGRIAELIGVHIPADVRLDPLRKLLSDRDIVSEDIIDIAGVGRLYRTSNAVMAFPTPSESAPQQITNFRIDVTKRVGFPSGSVSAYAVKLTFVSGNIYNLQIPTATFRTAVRLMYLLDSRVREEDKPVRFEHATITPATVVHALDTHVIAVAAPRTPTIRGDWFELPRIRINVKDGSVEGQVERAPLNKIPAFQGLAYANYRESLASFRHIWGSKNPSDVALALGLSQAAYAFLSAITCNRARVFASASCLVVIDDVRSFSRDLLSALCYILNGGASTYKTNLRHVRRNNNVLPSIVVLPAAPSDIDTLPVSPVIVFAAAVNAASAMAQDRPGFLHYTAEHPACRTTRLSVVAHLQASFPYLLSEIVKRMLDMSHRLVSMQPLPAIYMYKLLASEFGFPVAPLADELIVGEYSGLGGSPLDIMFAALQHMRYKTDLMKCEHVEGLRDIPSKRTGATAAVFITPDFVAVNTAVYGHLAAYSRDRYGYAASSPAMRSALSASEYGHHLSSHDSYWCMSRRAWDTRVESLREEVAQPVLRLA